MGKLPAFQFYPADWRKDPGVQSLSFHDRGVWFEILCLMHESEQRGRLLLNGKSMPDEALARLLGLDKQILTKTVATLLEYGVASRDKNGALMNRRMVRDENLRIIRQKSGKLGGNPLLKNSNQDNDLGDLVKQNSTKTKNEVKQKSTPSSSSSSSNHNNRACARGSPFQVTNPLIAKLAEITKTDLDGCGERALSQLSEAAENLRLKEKGKSDLEIAELVGRFGEWFSTRGFKDPTPAIRQIAKDWGRFKETINTKRRAVIPG